MIVSVDRCIGTNRFGRFRLVLRRKFWTQLLVRHRNRLPKEAEVAISVEVFKLKLDEALDRLIYQARYITNSIL